MIRKIRMWWYTFCIKKSAKYLGKDTKKVCKWVRRGIMLLTNSELEKLKRILEGTVNNNTLNRQCSRKKLLLL